VLPVIHRRGEDFSRVGDRAEELDARQRPARRDGGKGFNARADGRQVGDERIEAWQRLGVPGQNVERRRHVPHGVALDEAEAVVVKAAQTHAWNLTLELAQKQPRNHTE
jgi:hypothetical protein